MPRPSNPEVRRRLLESGLTLIGKQGFAGSGVADITTAAGVPKGSFYQYFDSKQSYAIELLDDYWSAVEEKHTKVLLDDRYAPLDRKADVEELAAALIESWEGAVMRSKIERSGAAFKRFETVVLPRLLA